ncbi:MAG TPA: sugar kinase, partial [Myxococcales bacterium]|nr:sugar kinase [Myxococcales bacterium]
SMGPRIVVIKRGEYGAILFDGKKAFTAPGYPIADVFDPTGAGDTFAGGFMGYLAHADDLGEKSLRRALVMGSVMASFTIEGFSLDRLTAVSEPEIFERFGHFKDLTAFDDLGPGALRAAS